MDRRALIESPTSTRDAFGAIVPGWTAVATVWASVIPVRGTERVAQGAQISTALYEVSIRWRSDIAANCRVTVDGRVMQIRSITEVGRRVVTKLMCEEIQ